MHISFSPQRRNEPLTVSKSGDILTINGQSFDFSALPDGATIPDGEVPCDWIAGPVERVSRALHLTLILPHGPNPSRTVAFPTPLVVSEDGPLPLPLDSIEEAANVEG
jgi:hypothetical protein